MAKICPSCRAEFVDMASRCSDCGTALVDLDSFAPGHGHGLDAAGEAPLREPVLLRQATAAWIELLAEELARAGIRSRVEIATGERAQQRATLGPACSLFVERADVPAAARIDTAVAREQIPDVPDDEGTLPGELDACPACGTELHGDATECPECGLGFGADPE
jgi:hypothetical protein